MAKHLMTASSSVARWSYATSQHFLISLAFSFKIFIQLGKTKKTKKTQTFLYSIHAPA